MLNFSNIKCSLDIVAGPFHACPWDRSGQSDWTSVCCSVNTWPPSRRQPGLLPVTGSTCHPWLSASVPTAPSVVPKSCDHVLLVPTSRLTFLLAVDGRLLLCKPDTPWPFPALLVLDGLGFVWTSGIPLTRGPLTETLHPGSLSPSDSSLPAFLPLRHLRLLYMQTSHLWLLFFLALDLLSRPLHSQLLLGQLGEQTLRAARNLAFSRPPRKSLLDTSHKLAI